jgi:pyruvate kinase
MMPMLPRPCRAKIVATLGPASSSPDVIRALLEAGADVFRLNFSHGSHAEHAQRYAIIRELEQETGRPIGVLADLQGPKLRVGRLADGQLPLEVGARLRFDLDPAPGTAERVPLPHPEVFAALAPGVQLLLDDGKIRLEVETSDPESATARVLVGGPLKERKGVSMVGAVLPVSALTEKDRKDLDFVLELGVDWVALSFVQRPEDMDEVRTLVRGGPGCWPSWRSPRRWSGSTRSWRARTRSWWRVAISVSRWRPRRCPRSSDGSCAAAGRPASR